MFSPHRPAAQGGRPGVRARSLTTTHHTTKKIKQRKSTQSRRRVKKLWNASMWKRKRRERRASVANEATMMMVRDSESEKIVETIGLESRFAWWRTQLIHKKNDVYRCYVIIQFTRQTSTLDIPSLQASLKECKWIGLWNKMRFPSSRCGNKWV